MFEAAVAKAVPLFQRSKGCRGLELQRSIEKPSKYRLVVKWETVEDHVVHFRGRGGVSGVAQACGAAFCVGARGRAHADGACRVLN